MLKQPKILISGGGTGGHIFPAIAIANGLKMQYPKAKIEFVGAKGRMEMEKVPKAGYTIHGLWISGFQRKLSFQNLSFPFKLLSSLWQSKKIVKKFNPDVTIGVGGFASGPLNYMAARQNIPLVIQEQNSYPGVTNKLLKNKAAVICVAYEKMERFFPSEKIVLTGNPIRQDLINNKITNQEARKYFSLEPNKKTILVVGGSLGARTINHAIEEGLSLFNQNNIQLIWQTGKFYDGEFGNFDWGLKTQFIERMDMAYKAADIVISRAGALSISELSLLGKASILVPSPNVAEDHQTKNAKALADIDAAWMCQDINAKDNLCNMALDLINQPRLLNKVAANILNFAKPNATQKIVEQIVSLIEK